ncbi:MAG: hypothetical protein NUV56_04335 [Candidatus Uhrbacteria bacterium]|nr:hypothetical protein [Candidatus Uhrbacteria bacterium]
MPVIRIDFDDEKVSDEQAAALSEAVQRIISEVTAIEDVMVYANVPRINVKIHPIEIFVHMSAHKIANPDQLIGELKTCLQEWKKESTFPHLLNLTLIPEPWKTEIGI